jgi:hypothetical protein
MTALDPTADTAATSPHVAFVPEADLLGVVHQAHVHHYYAHRSAASKGTSRTIRSQRGGSPNILRITLSASASKHRPWLSKIRCGCHE